MPYASIARLTLKHARAVIGVLVLITATLAALGLPPEVEGDLLKLAQPGSPEAVALEKLRASPGGEGTALIALPEGTDLDAAVEAIQAAPTVQLAFHRPPDDLAQRLALLQLDPATTDGLTARIQAAMAVPSPLLHARLLSEDLVPAVEPILPSGVVVVFPTHPPTDPVFCEALLADLESAAPAAIAIEGTHMGVARTAREIRGDLTRTAGWSLALVVGVLAIMLRSGRALVALVPPLMMAVTASVSLTQLLSGALNTYTAMGAAILLGLGIDFGIHLMARYRELRGEGRAPQPAVVGAWEEVGPPCMTAALTSAAGFLALTVADFRGISQLGLALTMGVATCLAFMLLLLPILLVRLDPAPIPPRTAQADRRLPTRGLLAAGLALTAAAAVLWPQLAVEYDTTAMRTEGSAWSELSEEARALRERAFPPVVVSVADAEARAAEHARLQGLIDEGALPHVRGVLSLQSVIPLDQDARLDALRRLQALSADPRRSSLPPPVLQQLDQLAGVDLSPITADHLPPALQRLLGVDRPQILLLTRGNMRDLRESHALSRELSGVVEDAASDVLAFSTLYLLLTRDLKRFVLTALSAVLLILALDLRRPRLILIAAGGLLGGLTWAGGGMAAADIRITIANIVALPILLGIGVDVVIHLLHRLEATGSVSETLRTSGYAALTSTLTTLAAFIALTTAGNRGVRSTGEAITLGLALVFVAAAVLVPSAWATLRVSRG